jgi:hypothetical protein
MPEDGSVASARSLLTRYGQLAPSVVIPVLHSCARSRRGGCCSTAPVTKGLGYGFGFGFGYGPGYGYGYGFGFGYGYGHGPTEPMGD